MPTNITRRQLPADLVAWAIDSYLRGRQPAEIADVVRNVTGITYHPGSIAHWCTEVGVKFGGDRRRPPPPDYGATAVPAPATHEQTIIRLTGRMAEHLGREAPQTYHEAEEILAIRKLPSDANADTLVASNDWQGMWIDPTAMRTRRNILRLIQPRTIAYLGDIWNADAFSPYDADPETDALPALEDERALINAYLDEDRKLAPEAALLFCEGNHEHWMGRWLNRNASQLKRAFKHELSIAGMIRADERRMQVRPWKGAGSTPFNWHGLRLKHSANSTITPGANVQREARRKPATSMAFGHNHRAEALMIADNERDLLYTYYSNGCLCRVKGEFEYLAGESDWVQSCLVAHWINGRLHVELCPFQDYATIVNGCYVTADGVFRL